MKAWLKGGLIACGMFIILMIVGWVTYFLLSQPTKNNQLFWILIFIPFSPCILVAGGEVRSLICVILGPIITIVTVFILGALIGWIVGKMRTK